jgi:hypothetical protein
MASQSQQDDADNTQCFSPDDGYREQKKAWDTPGDWDIGTQYANAKLIADGIPSPLRTPHEPLNVERLCQLLEEVRRNSEQEEREALVSDNRLQLDSPSRTPRDGWSTDPEASPSWSPSECHSSAVDVETPPSPLTPATPAAPGHARTRKKPGKRKLDDVVDDSKDRDRANTKWKRQKCQRRSTTLQPATCHKT